MTPKRGRISSCGISLDVIQISAAIAIVLYAVAEKNLRDLLSLVGP